MANSITPPPEPKEAVIPDQYKGHQVHVYRAGFHAGYKHGLTQTNAALAQPEPEGLTDEALANFSDWFCRNYPGPDTIIHKPEWHAPKVFRAAAYALARWGRPAIGTVPTPANGLEVQS